MAASDRFTHTDPDLLPILDQLLPLEPIFHTSTFGLTAEQREQRLAADYWEIGASGRRYSREFILGNVSETHFSDATLEGWTTRDHALRRLGPETYLLTYTLLQGERLTRRSTVWQSAPTGWTILFHQGTVVSAEEDDLAPPSVKQ